MKFSNTLVYVLQGRLLGITGIIKFLQFPFCFKIDKSLVKVLYFGHLWIKMVPKPINGADVLVHKTSLNLFLVQWEARNTYLLWHVIDSFYFSLKSREINRFNQYFSVHFVINCTVICSNYSVPQYMWWLERCIALHLELV